MKMVQEKPYFLFFLLLFSGVLGTDAGIIEVASGFCLDTTKISKSEVATEGFLASQVGSEVNRVVGLPIYLNNEWFDILSGYKLSSIDSKNSTTKDYVLIAKTFIDTSLDYDGDKLSNGFENFVSLSDPNLEVSSQTELLDFAVYIADLNPVNLVSERLANVIEVTTFFTLDTSTDDDGDNISNSIEKEVFGSKLNNADSNLDGLSDLLDILYYGIVKLENKDTSSMQVEVQAAVLLDTTTDSEDDGLSDGIESYLGATSKLVNNTYQNGLNDFFHLILNLRPKEDFEKEASLVLIADLLLDTSRDFDSDGLTVGFENNFSFTDDNKSESSLSGYTDLLYFTLGRPKSIEEAAKYRLFDVIYQLLVDTTSDFDGDGMTDGFERATGIYDYQIVDSNGDGIGDKLNYISGNDFPDSASDPELPISLRIVRFNDTNISIEIYGQFKSGQNVRVLKSNDLELWDLNVEFRLTEDSNEPLTFIDSIESLYQFFRVELGN